MKSEREELLKESAKDMAAARTEFKELQRVVDDLVRDCPSGIPLSDGQVRIVKAGQRLRRTFERYQNAFRRYYDFVLFGIVPPPYEGEPED